MYNAIWEGKLYLIAKLIIHNINLVSNNESVIEENDIV